MDSPIVDKNTQVRTEQPKYRVGEKIKQIVQSDFSKSVGNITLDSIKMALALVVALAWNTAIKYLINKLWQYDNNNLIMHLIYAVIVTILFVAFIFIAQKKLNYKGDAKIQYAVVGM